MTEYIANKITIWLLNNKLINEEDFELYYLGNEVIVSTGTTFFIILCIGFWLSNLAGAIIFLICFMSIRSFSGGYHAKTRLGCLGTTVISYIGSYFITNLQMKYADDMQLEIWGLEIFISYLIFYEYAPIENKNKKFLPGWKKRNRNWMFAVIACWIIAGMLISVINTEITSQIFNIVFIISMLVLKARREDYAEN